MIFTPSIATVSQHSFCSAARLHTVKRISEFSADTGRLKDEGERMKDEGYTLQLSDSGSDTLPSGRVSAAEAMLEG
jgi:hypothetical protein